MKKILFSAIMLISLLGYNLQAQVTIGSGIAPTRAALLELKSQQEAGTVSSVSDEKNITSDIGGLLLPRVKLVNINTLEPFIAKNDPEFVANTNSMKEKLAGLMVYNITDNGPGSNLYPALYTWNGNAWETSQANEAISSILTQPAKFSFYETGTETAAPLTFKVDGLGTWTYQWYQVTGNNVHVRIGTEIGKAGTIYTNTTTATTAGAYTETFTPQAALKGTTRHGANNGFYKFYCIAKSSLGAELVSDIAEVAVGCGAKNVNGDWISFMCYNLGAGKGELGTASFSGITMEEQKNWNGFPAGYSASIDRDYYEGEEIPFGNLFQWGRIADGHELRYSDIFEYADLSASNDIANGLKCAIGANSLPESQVKTTSAAYGKYITVPTSQLSEHWNPNNEILLSLWKTAGHYPNDPCAHYKVDGSYQAFWNEGIPSAETAEACTNPGTQWRMPTQYEWSSIFIGGTASGSATASTANTWVWKSNGSNPVNDIRGFEVKPDGITTTLFLPAAGWRNSYGKTLRFSSSYGTYWSADIVGTNPVMFRFNSTHFDPAEITNSQIARSVRCIKQL